MRKFFFYVQGSLFACFLLCISQALLAASGAPYLPPSYAPVAFLVIGLSALLFWALTELSE